MKLQIEADDSACKVQSWFRETAEREEQQRKMCVELAPPNEGIEEGWVLVELAEAPGPVAVCAAEGQGYQIETQNGDLKGAGSWTNEETADGSIFAALSTRQTKREKPTTPKYTSCLG